MVTKVRLILRSKVISGPDRSDFQADNVRSMPVMPQNFDGLGSAESCCPRASDFRAAEAVLRSGSAPTDQCSLKQAS